MKKTIAVISIATIVALACPLIASADDENEQTVSISEVPPAVQTVIKDEAGSNEIVRIAKKTEDGQTVYEAVVNKNGKDWTIDIDENGTVLKEYEASTEHEEENANS